MPTAQIVARVFHLTLQAFHARLYSGAIWGAPHFEDGEWRFAIKKNDGSGTGFLISVVEFQQRGHPHAHIVVRFAEPPAGSKEQYNEGDRVPWIDECVLHLFVLPIV